MSAVAVPLKTLPCMKKCHNGAHCGLTDWYPELEKGIRAALKRGRAANWTTGWYSSKKEIASARLTHEDGQLTVEVHVTDDLDTEGHGTYVIPHTTSLDKIRGALDYAWEKARANQKDNQIYVGFAVHNPKGEYVETYLGQRGEGHHLPNPPGDYYDQWGFQESVFVPLAIRRKLAKWAHGWGIDHEDESFTYRGWTIRPWTDDTEAQ
jgi:hypothetical protein